MKMAVIYIKHGTTVLCKNFHWHSQFPSHMFRDFVSFRLRNLNICIVRFKAIWIFFYVVRNRSYNGSDCIEKEVFKLYCNPVRISYIYIYINAYISIYVIH